MFRCMRTTINLDDQLLRDTRLLARQTGQTLTAVIEDALRERLARRHVAAACGPTLLPKATGLGLLPGLDLDNSAALRELMDAAS
jgi:Ribbon-helix-helix protein, copG family